MILNYFLINLFEYEELRKKLTNWAIFLSVTVWFIIFMFSLIIFKRIDCFWSFYLIIFLFYLDLIDSIDISYSIDHRIWKFEFILNLFECIAWSINHLLHYLSCSIDSFLIFVLILNRCNFSSNCLLSSHYKILQRYLVLNT